MESSTNMYVIEGTMAGAHYNDKTVYLTDPFTKETFAQTTVKDKKFFLQFPDNGLKIYQIVYKYSNLDLFPLTLPVIGGEGNVQVYMGGKIVTTGTPSNDALQDFLLAKDKFTDEITESGIAVDEIRARLKGFLSEQVVNNKDSIVSIYILKSYASRFTEEEKQALLQQIKPELVALY